MSAARTNTCSKCGAIGFTARTCGRTHNVAGDPPRDVIAKPKTTNPPPLSCRPIRSVRTHRSRRGCAPYRRSRLRSDGRLTRTAARSVASCPSCTVTTADRRAELGN